jgi:hypothetical protein
MLNESEAWLMVGELVLKDTNLFSVKMGLCGYAAQVRTQEIITWDTKESMLARIEMHLGGEVWAYEWSNLFTSEEYLERYREARCLAALWLSYEAEGC